MAIYNIMSCEGFDTGILGGCSMAWFSVAITFFLAMVLRRQSEDLLGMQFNLPGALGAGLGLNILITTLTGSVRWSLLAGILGVAIGGFVLGLFFEGGGGGDYE